MNWKRISACAIGAFFCLAGMFASVNEKGIDYYRAELYVAAELYFESQIPSLQGTDLAEAYYYMGECYAATNKLDKAEEYYQKAIQANSEYPYSYIGQGKLALLNKNVKAANDLFKKAIGYAKKDPAIHTSVAEAYIDAKQYTEAEDVLDKARSIKKNFSGIYVAEGDMLMAQEKLGDAAARYENAIVFDPNDKVAYLKEARVYKAINPDMALEILNRLIAVDPNYIPAYAELGETYYKKNNYTKAIEAYNRFINIHGVPEKHQVIYASLLFFTKDYMKSLEEINKVLSVEPNNLVMRRLQIYNNYELENYQLGLELSEKFIQSTKKDDLIAQDYTYYGRLLDKSKNTIGAIEAYNKALSLDNSKTDVYKDLAEAYERNENYAEAIKNYQFFIENDKNATLMDVFNFGRTCYNAGNQATVTGDALAQKTPEELAADSLQRRDFLLKADSVFAQVEERSPDSYLGVFWRARTNTSLDPDSKLGLAKPFYEAAAAKLEAASESASRNRNLIECYRYMLAYYYLVMEDNATTKIFCNKILEIDPENELAQQILAAIK